MTDNATDNVTDKNKERIKVLIKYLGQNNSISNKEAQSLLGISEATAKRFLNSLVKENLLVAVGEYKARKYIKKIKRMKWSDDDELYKSTGRYRKKKF